MSKTAGKLKKGYQEIRYFEFKDAHSSKFWEVSVAGSTVTVRYGKIDTNGQTSVKELDSPEEAQEHASKQAAGKMKKGYQESDINENIRKHIDNMVKSYTEDDNPI